MAAIECCGEFWLKSEAGSTNEGTLLWLMVFLNVLVAAGRMSSSGSVVGDVAYVVVGPKEIDLAPLLLTPSLRKEDLIRGAVSVAEAPMGMDLVNRAAKSKEGGTFSCGTGARGGSLEEARWVEKWWSIVSVPSPWFCCCCCWSCWKLIIITPGGWGVIGLRQSASSNVSEWCCCCWCWRCWWRSWLSSDWQSLSRRRKSRSASDADFSASLARCCICCASYQWDIYSLRISYILTHLV